MTRAPALSRRGPGLRVEKHHLPTGSSGCHIRTCRRRRCGVRGSHKRDRRPPLVRWKLRCPPQSCNCVLVAGDPTVFSPPFPLLPICGAVVLPAGVEAHATSWPRTRAANCPARPGAESASPRLFCPDLNYIRTFHVPCLAACGVGTSTAVPSEPRNGSGALLDARSDSSAFSSDLFCQRQEH